MAKKQLLTAVIFCILVIFWNIIVTKLIIMLKYESKVINQIITNNASVLCMKLPSVISLICIYNGILEPDDIERGNIKSKANIVKKTVIL